MTTRSQNTPSIGATKNLELPNELKEFGFSKVTVPMNSHTKNLIMVHNNKPAIATLDIHNWSNTDKSVKAALSNIGIDNKTIEKFMVFLSQEYVKVMEEALIANGTKEEENKDKKVDYRQKYSNGLLAEAILIVGQPYFLVLENAEISIVPSIDLEDKIIKPLEQDMYLSRPYTFTSEHDVREHIEKTKKENLDTLFQRVKTICRRYIDADDFHITICAADIVYTYYQDKIGLTHYLFFVGNNDSGKSNNLRVIHILSYRNFMSTDITAPNIFQFLGNHEEGQGTLCIDEADNIDTIHELMSIFKNGYTTGFPVPRIDTSSGRKQYRFFTFGFKAFAAERLPDSVKAKGLNQRIIPLPCIYGVPPYDISEILNPAGEQEHQALLDELNETRNTLLIYRLLHHNDSIPDIKLNLNGREKQLFKPILRVFQNTQIQNELLPIISKYISDRRESNCNSLYAFLYKVIKDLIKAQDTTELESTLIWNTITELLPGDPVPNKKLSYDSAEFGILSQKGIVEIFIQIFGAKHSKDRREKRKLIFDIHKLDRIGRIYELSIDIKVSTTSSAVTYATDMTHIGLDKHFVEQSSDAQLANSSILNDNNSEQIDESNCNHNQEITTKEEEQDLTMPAHPSQASHPSLTNQVDVRSNNELQSKKDDYEEDSKDNHRANYDAYNSPTDEANRSRENVFWQRFDELEGQSTDKTVKGEQLKSSLVSSNKLFVGDAELMIEHMLRTRKIEKIYFDTYRRAKLNDYDANQKTAVLNDVAQNNEKDNKSIDSVAQSAMSDTILQEDKQLVRSVDLSVSESDIKSTSLTNNTTYQKTQLYNQQSVPTNDDQYYQHNLHKNERRLKSKENMIISICSRCNEEGYPNYYTHESYRFTECIHENREHKIEKVCSTGMICGSLNDLFTEDFWNKSEQRDSIRDRGQERRKKYWSSKGIFFDTGRKQDKGKI